MKNSYRSTRQERIIYDNAFKLAVKETTEKFPELNNSNMDDAMAFRDRRLAEILLSASSPQVGALRILEQKRATAQREAERSAEVRSQSIAPKPKPTLPLSAAPAPAPAPAPPLLPKSPPQQQEPRIRDDLLIGANAIAEELGVTPCTVYHLVKTKRLPIGRLGKTLIASKTKLRRVFANLT